MGEIFHEIKERAVKEIVIKPGIKRLKDLIDDIIAIIKEEERISVTEQDFVEWLCLAEILRYEEESGRYRPVRTSGETMIYISGSGLQKCRHVFLRPAMQEFVIEHLPDVLEYAGKNERDQETAEAFIKSEGYRNL